MTDDTYITVWSYSLETTEFNIVPRYSIASKTS